MPWIYFERDEPAAPSIKLPSLDGGHLEPADFRGVSSLVLFFAHGLECRLCRSFIDQLSQAAGAMRVQGSEALVILPQAPAQARPAPSGLHLLVDRDGALRQAYEAIFEFDLSSQPLLFILDQFNAPFRAWVGADPDPEVLPQMLKYLESASLLCPE
jgi:peroxiredoxin